MRWKVWNELDDRRQRWPQSLQVWLRNSFLLGFLPQTSRAGDASTGLAETGIRDQETVRDLRVREAPFCSNEEIPQWPGDTCPPADSTSIHRSQWAASQEDSPTRVSPYLQLSCSSPVSSCCQHEAIRTDFGTHFISILVGYSKGSCFLAPLASRMQSPRGSVHVVTNPTHTPCTNPGSSTSCH